MKKAIVLIGHTKFRPGAVSFTKETEYQFNKKVAERIAKNFSADSVIIIDKTENDFVKKIYEFSPELILELHFNSFKEVAYGCEALVIQSSKNSVFVANELLDFFSSRFKIKKRGVKELSRPVQRGYANFNNLHNFCMVLFEPCFANFCTSDSKKIILNWQDYSNFLADFIRYKLGYKDTLNKSLLTKMTEIIRSWFKGENK